MERAEIYQKIVEYLRQYDPARVGVFGSFARGEEKSESDIDLLVTFKRGFSLLDVVGMEIDLSRMIGRKVELIVEPGVEPRLRQYIEKDLKILFG